MPSIVNGSLRLVPPPTRLSNPPTNGIPSADNSADKRTCAVVAVVPIPPTPIDGGSTIWTLASSASPSNGILEAFKFNLIMFWQFATTKLVPIRFNKLTDEFNAETGSTVGQLKHPPVPNMQFPIST